MEIKAAELIKHVGHQLQIKRHDGTLVIGCDTCTQDIGTEQEKYIFSGRMVISEERKTAYLEHPESGDVYCIPLFDNESISVLAEDWFKMDFSKLLLHEVDEIRKLLRPLLCEMRVMGVGALDEYFGDDIIHTYNSAEDRMYVLTDTDVWNCIMYRAGRFHIVYGDAYAMIGDEGEVFTKGAPEGYATLEDAIKFIVEPNTQP